MEKKKVCWMMAATALLAAGIAQAVECPEQIPDLVSYWKLDEASGAVAYDSAGANDGTLAGNPAWDPAGGRIDGALVFDGSDDYVDCGDDPSLNFGTESSSISLWMKADYLTNPTNQATLISKYGDGGPGGGPGGNEGDCYRIFLDENSDKIRVILRDSDMNRDDYISSISVLDQKYHHVVMVRDTVSSKLLLYIDGVLDINEILTATNEISTSNILTFGARELNLSADYGMYFDGLIDDVAFFNRALTEDEIMQIYLDGVEGFGLALDHKMAAVAKIKKAIDVKNEAIKTVNAAIIKEQASLAALEELQDCDDPGLRPQAIRQAIQRIEQAIGRQENIRKELRKSIRSLNIVLWQLGCIQGNCD